MPAIKLTSRPEIAKIKHPETGTEFYSHDGDALRGIRLAVGARTKSWILTKRINGKVRSVKLGEWPEVANGGAAEEIAKKKIAELVTGTDAASTKVVTLMDAFDSHVARSHAKEATIDTYRLQIKNHLSDLFAQPIEQITLPMLENAIKGKTPSTAKHLVQIIKMAFRRASIIRRCFDVSADLKPPQKHRVSSSVLFDAADAWPALDLILASRSMITRTAWLTMLFTGFRSLNVRALDWEQVDLQRKTITLDEMKNGLSRTFPVADVLIEALKALPHRQGYVFPADSKTGHIDQLMARTVTVGERDDAHKVKVLRQHDCRRLFTTAARRARLPEYIIDELRGDTPKKVQDIYDQGSANHADVNKIAARILKECGASPASVLERIKRPDL
ncbi:tyrosine-type recombinase/integrase [Acidimangrovimonas sediminis]|uniref:tyrosine-type recombinase/integrase n=1 Tax=Acidimangrovimonas sediminis TaxID=2056283 RepID=UPI0013050485|nr:tyrosine-type recombinase/integrase [Acidimangrovimonas sediminis]